MDIKNKTHWISIIMKGEKVFSRKVNLFLTCSIVPEIIPQWPISAQEKNPLFLPTRLLKERKIVSSSPKHPISTASHRFCTGLYCVHIRVQMPIFLRGKNVQMYEFLCDVEFNLHIRIVTVKSAVRSLYC